ncbi:MAG: DUF2141 domain-containing protein [Myxococcales bacterium]|nr:DUF2141 domain-containing protein [Myxococcales bacterium]
MLLWALTVPCLATPDAGEQVSLSVAILALPSDAGRVMCSLYASADTWLSDTAALHSVVARPAGRRAVCDFGLQPAGHYAVAFFHDVNDNGRMDYTALGLPKEPWGVSNDAPAMLSAPRFRAAAFVHPGSAQRMSAR